MKVNEIEVSWDSQSRVLTIGRPLATAQLHADNFCDNVYEKKGDTMVVRMQTMTRFRFEGWTKNQEDTKYVAVASFIQAATPVAPPTTD